MMKFGGWVVFSLLYLNAAAGFAKSEQPQAAAAPTIAAPNKAQAQAAMWATRFLTRFHYKRVPLDDAMSAQIFNHYLESLDADKLFFLRTDVDRFSKQYQSTLDDAIYDQELTPPYEIFKIYSGRVKQATEYARGLLAKGFDFSVPETYRFERKNENWPLSANERNELWRKRVKNDWLRLKLAGKSEEQIRKTLDKRYKSFESRLAELDSEDIFQTFMNAYALAIEPHTGYLAPRTAENFNIQMRLSLEGIGAVLSKDDEYTVVRQVVKGGPADQTGKLHVGDRIIGVAQDKSKAVQDVIGWRVDDVVELIRGPKGTTVVLDVQPKDMGADAKPIHIPIVRDTVKLEEQAAKKSIIETRDGAKTRKIGIVYLPAFYHDFEGHRRGDSNYRSSTRDVAKLIDELKAERVEGIVIDLRDNGGGSLTEATNLTGLFIDRGPVVQVKDAQGKISVEQDDDAQIAWNGPLAVLINRTSASASEIFAAALQDYGRALVIGATSYGKGTVQNLIDLDDIAKNDQPKFGQLKLTIAQFFRINGGSTQNRGVVPDLAFPQTIDPEEWGESANENALPWSSIPAAKYSARGDFRDILPLLHGKHEARVVKNKEYQYWLEDIREYTKLREKKEISLLESERKVERDALEQKRKKRAAEREALAGADAKAKGAASQEVDDGLQADEREPAAQEDDSVDEPDVLLTEAANVLSDAINLLGHDRALAAKVKAFSLNEGKPAP